MFRVLRLGPAGKECAIVTSIACRAQGFGLRTLQESMTLHAKPGLGFWGFGFRDFLSFRGLSLTVSGTSWVVSLMRLFAFLYTFIPKCTLHSL